MAKPITEEKFDDHALTHTANNSWWLYGRRGVALCRICGMCYEVAQKRYGVQIHKPADQDEDL